jgi:uncharacterized surface protein with fasciclin (FAS1) repeats
MKAQRFFSARYAKLAAYMFLVGALAFSSCSKEEDTMDPEPTIVDIVSTNDDFKILRAAVVRAGLATSLSSGELTVFAPNDQAFEKSGLPLSVINSLDVATLQAVLGYHVVEGIKRAADLPQGNNSSQATVAGPNIFITKNTGVSINGIAVISADIMAANGVIHVIDEVLLPPQGDIVDIAVANQDVFSLLIAAVQKAGLVDALKGNGPLTVFAPVNAAFNAIGINTASDFDALDNETLIKILTTHVVSGQVFSTNLSSGIVSTLSGEEVSILLQSGVSVRGTGNETGANVVKANILGTNGVVHVIDKVILP